MARPDLDVWVVTGDGDGLSIGGNHLIHALRRNVNLTILLFNNQIYGLDQGPVLADVARSARSPSRRPFGSARPPVQPAVAWRIGAEATFVARTHDIDRKHMHGDLPRARTTTRAPAFVEIFQNCNVFNDGAFDDGHIAKACASDMLIHAGARRADPLRRRWAVAASSIGSDGQLRLVAVADVGERRARSSTTRTAPIRASRFALGRLSAR